jgi:hypothetical protein
VLAWLLAEDDSTRIREILAQAEMIVTSDLTLIECDRVLVRAARLRELREADAADRRAHLVTAASHWHLLRVSSDVIDRARRPFPLEPIRTLDALHLASALVARAAVEGIELLSLDERVRSTGASLGFALQPA